MKQSDPPILLDYSYSCTLEALWKALTQHSEMVQWYFGNIPEFQPEVDFTTEFSVSSEERTFTHLWKVTAVAPLQKITYNWSYLEYPGNADLSLSISEGENGTKLSLKLVINETFPQDIPEFKRESCIAGWNYFLKQNLTAYLIVST